MPYSSSLVGPFARPRREVIHVPRFGVKCAMDLAACQNCKRSSISVGFFHLVCRKRIRTRPLTIKLSSSAQGRGGASYCEVRDAIFEVVALLSEPVLESKKERAGQALYGRRAGESESQIATYVINT
jgi:hypothetical protein